MNTETETFADAIADYMATRVKPWENESEMREAVHDALRLTFTEARDDPRNPAAGLARPSDEARFVPMGDNHHNAVACPYCSPSLPKPVPSGLTAEKLREIADDLDKDTGNFWDYVPGELREWADALSTQETP